MRSFWVYLFYFVAASLVANGQLLKNEKANDAIDSMDGDHSNEGTSSEGDDLSERYFGPPGGQKWGKKPGGWHKGRSPVDRPSCGKPGTTCSNNGSSPVSPTVVTKPTPPKTESTVSTLATSQANNEPEETTKPTSQPTEATTFIETRPTFITTGATVPTPVTKPYVTPTIPSKPPLPNTPEGTVSQNSGETSNDHTQNPKDKEVDPNKEVDPDAPSDEININKCMAKCSITAEDDPVCGSNGRTYINFGHFRCAKTCGVAVQSYSQGSCPKPPHPCPSQPNNTSSEGLENCLRRCPVTKEYNPVCGTDGVTYANKRQLFCAKQCGAPVNLRDRGPCPETGVTPNPTKDKVNSSEEVRQCIRNCPVTTEYSPVCASNGFTYSNPGRLACAKACGVEIDVRHSGPCRATPATPPTISRNTPLSIVAKACLSRCPVTPEFNPVCGTDFMTYSNPGRLYCAQLCGSDVKQLRPGSCDINAPPATVTEATLEDAKDTEGTTVSVARETQSPEVTKCIRSCPVTPEYNPVCGTNYQTYSNPGQLHCAKFCGVSVSMLRPGPCPKQRPTTPATSVTKGPTTPLNTSK